MFGISPLRKHEDNASALHLRKGRPSFGPTIAVSFAPFALTFAVVFVFSWRTLFPLLSGQSTSVSSHDNGARLRNSTSRVSKIPGGFTARMCTLVEHMPATAFSTTVALSAVLAELIFCEISGLLNAFARATALQGTISALLVSLVIVIPALEIHHITSAAGWKFSGLRKQPRALAWLMDLFGLIIWFVLFWWLGRAVLGSHPFESGAKNQKKQHGISEGSVERIGIIGVSLMASLAGFAAVSSLWQTFGVRTRKVTETDIARKQSGLDATTDFLQAKELRLRALERKQSHSPSASTGNFAFRVFNSVHRNNENEEIATLRLEVDGLETMQHSLNTSVRLLRARREAQMQASTPLGRIFLTASYAFSIYCIYRIATTSLTALRRWFGPARNTSFAATDPINHFLSIVAKHWDPSIDRAAWSRQISFLLSGLMLLASFNAVLQTVLLFSRFTPQRLLYSAQQNLALFVAQISGTYVVSSALLLRSNLPREMSSVIEGALGAPLDSAFVEQWFEVWFLGACAITAAGILVGRKVLGKSNWEDELDPASEPDVETGKQS